LLRDPVTRVKELAGEPGSDDALELFTKIFALEDELEAHEREVRVREAEQQWEAQKKEYAAISKEQDAVVRS
ncbi:glutamyl-tRNA reductase, partial [Flavobacterium sp. IR1]